MKTAINRCWLASLGVVALALTACSPLISGDSDSAYPKRYTLPEPTAPAQSAAHTFPVVLRVDTVSAPDWLSSSQMVYQLGYQKQGQLASYTQSQWAAPPPAMVAQALQDGLANSDQFKAVTGAGDVAGDIELQVTLSNFIQQFVSRHASFGLLNARATLVRSADDHVLAQHGFRYKVRAPGADAAGGVRALGNATGQFTAAISQWLTQTLTQCAPACLNAGSG